MRILKGILAGLLIVTAGSLSTALSAADVTKNDPPVAAVNGYKIFQSEVDQARIQMGEQAAQYPPQIIQDFLVNNLIDARVAANAAVSEGINTESAIKRRIERLTEQLLRQELYLRKMALEMSEERIRARYDEFIKANPGQNEVHARHILLKKEDEAVAAIARLDKGEDFAKLAKELSTGPSGRSGGDLGFFSKDRMVAPFSAAAFALEVGAFTKKPVKTRFGWHVIKVENKRSGKPPPYEEARVTLRKNLQETINSSYAAELRAKSTIIIYGPDGKPK